MRRIRRRATTPAWPSAAPTAGPLAFALPSVLGGSVAAASAGPGENLCASDVLDHDPAAGQAPGVEGMEQYWRDFAASFPDFDLQVEVLTADNDHVTIVYRSTGTQQGDFLGSAPPASGSMSAVFRWRDSRMRRSLNGGDPVTGWVSCSSWGCRSHTRTS